MYTDVKLMAIPLRTLDIGEVTSLGMKIDFTYSIDARWALVALDFGSTLGSCIDRLEAKTNLLEVTRCDGGRANWDISTG